MKPIPVSAAEAIAHKYGYDQVVVIARKVGDDPAPHGEHCTTYGRNKEHCSVAARIGDLLKFKVMGWVKEQTTDHTPLPTFPAPAGEWTCPKCEGVFTDRCGTDQCSYFRWAHVTDDTWRLRGVLKRCRTVLANMALENKGAIFFRWPISHEPLRSDAKHLLPVIDAALSASPQTEPEKT